MNDTLDQPPSSEEPPVPSVDAPTESTLAPRKVILPYILLIVFVLTLIPGPLFLVGLIAQVSFPEPITVVVPRGAGVQEIAALLENRGVVIHRILFLAAARLVARNNLKAGEYKFEDESSSIDVATILRDGKCLKRQFTIPEGLTSQEIENLLKDVAGLKGDAGNILAQEYLLPETYFYVLDTSRAEIVKRMQNDAQTLLNEAWSKRQEGLPFRTPREALILASIVEKETGFSAQERARIAGVFVNRLRRGMPLQSDPTVIYAITEGKGPLNRSLTRKDLEKQSPYNTYVVNGLPPGPICHPGRAALKAVLAPEKNDYLYFVADGSGGHVFARTLDEHNQNVAQWRRFRVQTP